MASTVIGEKHQLKLALSSGSVHEHVELTWAFSPHHLVSNNSQYMSGGHLSINVSATYVMGWGVSKLQKPELFLS